MQHFRAEGRHFGSLFKGDNINTFCGRHHARVGGIDAWDVGPDIHAGSVQRFAEQRRRVVAAATAQSGGAAFGFAPDKALGDNNSFSQARCQLLF
ncbi:hypothetical protein D3C81_2107340 [compost metagenome]